MSKLILTTLVVGMVATTGVPVVPTSAGAAELLAPSTVRARHHARRLVVWPLWLPSRWLCISQGITIDLWFELRSAQF